jgi:hypothetical protein
MTHHYLENLVQAGQEKGFVVEQNIDYGAGPIDVVWNINILRFQISNTDSSS